LGNDYSALKHSLLEVTVSWVCHVNPPLGICWNELYGGGLFFDSSFDISPDGREVVIERVQERSNLVLLDLERP